MKLGVVDVNFRLPFEEALRKAREIGFQGVQIWVTGELDPERLEKGACWVKETVKRYGLEISALCGDLGYGFAHEEGLEWRIKKTKEYLAYSVELEAPIVTTHIGVIPEDKKHPDWDKLRRSLDEIGSYGEKVGAVLAAETGPEAPELMKEFFQSLNTTAIKVNYDPANLVMMGFDPVKGVYTLSSYIVHTHAKDGVRTPEGRIGEAPLGKGQVPWREYLTALKLNGYEGYLTVEREVGEEPLKDIVEAKDFLSSILKEIETK
ncbi:sugar phosphate isomerase/epimerase [bacterium]|nr:sugar phosphate isomerase/epimerase [bacterium]